MNTPVLTLDIESTGLDPWKDKILLIGYRIDNGPIQQIRLYDGETINEDFRRYLADPNTCKRGHNVSFDLLCLSANGLRVAGTLDDTRIIAYLNDPEQAIGLKDLVESKLHRKVVRMEDFGRSRLPVKMVKRHPGLVKNVVKSGKYWVSKSTLEKYNQADVINCDDLRKELIETKWYRDVEQPLSKILFDTEVRGIQLDIPHFERLENEYEEQIKELEKTISTEDTFNPNSTKQVKERFKAQGTDLDSTDKYTLKQLAWRGNDFADKLLKYRRISKLFNTYIIPFLCKADSNGKIHGRFNQAGRESLSLGDIKGTATGRLSSSDPNLQNIPTRTEEGKQIRRGFIASSGKVLIDSDLKQIEPRLIAHYSQSKVLLNAYEQGLDTHAIMGGLIFNKTPESLTRIERFIGKTSWLATVYGCYYKKLRQIVELNSDEPIFYDDEFYRKVQESFWQSNPEIASWRRQLLSTVRNTGRIETFGGREIRIRGIHSNNPKERNEAERKAINFLIQGSAADAIKLVLVELNHKLLDVDLLAVVHDETLMETANKDQVNNIDWIMCNSFQLKNVPVMAETHIIDNWGAK